MAMYDGNTFEQRFLQKLNPQQYEAATAVDGSVLLLATPGSGKTTVLVTRLGYMVCYRGIAPESILTMTYTRAATKDMKERFTSFFGADAAANLQFRTINGVSARIIEYVSNLRGQQPFALQDNEAELASIIRKIYQAVNKEYAEDSMIKDIRTSITYIKNMMLADEDIASLKSNVENLPVIYKQYQAELRNRKMMDYDDQMVYALTMLRSMPNVLEWFQKQFPYVCVDEAQDTSKIQHEIIKLLASKTENLFMVGDEDQSIYGFRAAYPEALLSFEADHPSSRVLLMEENYRSTPEIIDLANRFISQNVSRHEKTIKATRKSGSPVHVIQCRDREAQFALLLEMAKNCNRETAILFRNNDSALPLIDLFIQNGLDYNGRNMDDLFFTHRVVTDVLDILHFAYEPTNGELFLRIYYKFSAPISKKAATEAVQRSSRSGKSIFEELMHVPEIKGYVQDSVIELMEHLPKIKTDSAETAIHRIWDGMRYGRYVEQKGFDTGKYFILCMLAKGILSVPDFNNKLEALRANLSSHTNSGQNKITLSTIHSSKGLEYDQVYLLDIMDGIIPSKIAAEVQTQDEVKAYEEERRLYYVAMTRAKNELYLFSFGDKSSFTSESRSYLPIHAIAEDDVFSFLREPLLGKKYVDSEFGAGSIEAQCDDHLTIRFSDGSLRSFSLEEMLCRRDKHTVVPSTPRKNDRMALRPWQEAATSKIAAGLSVGTAVRHKAFGHGVICDISNNTMTIEFEDHSTKRFVVGDSLMKGFFELV